MSIPDRDVRSCRPALSAAGFLATMALAVSDVAGQSQLPPGTAMTFGSEEYDAVNGVAMWPDGAMVAVGQFHGTVDFDPGHAVVERTAQGWWDAFILVLGPDLTFREVLAYGGPGFEALRAVGIDEAGNVYVGGDMTGPDFEPGYVVDLDPGAGESLHVSQGGTDIFVTKLDPQLGHVWSRSEGSSYEFLHDLAVSPVDGSVAYGGLRSGDAFISSLDANGNRRWTRNFGGSDYDEVLALAFDSTGSLHATGYVEGVSSVNGWGSVEFFGGPDIFLAKIDGSGAYKSFEVMGSGAMDQGRSVSLRNGQEVVLGGLFSGGVDFDPGPADLTRVSSGGMDGFIRVTRPDGTVSWMQCMGGPGNDWVRATAADTRGRILACGYFEEQLWLQGSLLLQGHSDIFSMRLSPAGILDKAFAVGGSGWDEAEDMVLDRAGNPVLAGWYQGPMSFNHPGPQFPSFGDADAFVTRQRFDLPRVSAR